MAINMIQELSLNQIDSEAGKALAKALTVNHVLNHFDLQLNAVGSAGLALADAIKGRRGFELLL